MHLTNKATKRPQKPSAWWGFEGHFTPAACQAFNLAVEQFDDWFQERVNATYDEIVPERDPNAPLTHPVPRFRNLSEVLGYTRPEDREDGTGDHIQTTEAELSASEA